MGDADPISLPKDLPTHSIAILYSFATGKESWSQETFRALLTIIGYIGSMAHLPAPVVGSSPEVEKMFQDAADALKNGIDERTERQAIQILGSIVDNQQVSQGLIPWQLILAWALHKLVDKILEKLKS